jgi:hypothetical protein
MFQKLTFILILLVFAFSGLTETLAFIEKGDTLVIEQADVNLVPLNEIIDGDTLANGSRKHLVYELVSNGWYTLSNTLTAGTYDLNIIGGKRSNEDSRPVILVKEDFGGWFMISAYKNITLSGIHWMQAAETFGGNIGPWARAGIAIEDTNSRIRLHDNIMDFNTGFTLTAGKDGSNIEITNCLFRFNLPTNNNVWAGQGIDTRGAALDTVIIRNCTWYGGGPFMSITWESTQKLFLMDHCTIADWVQFPIHGVHYNNAVFTNNLFYNAHTMGEDRDQIIGQDPDGLPYGILNVDTVYVDSLTGVDWAAEGERKILISNNNNFVKQNIKDYWAVASSGDTIYHDFIVADPTYFDGFMNSRARSIFEDDSNWPQLVHENTTSLDPQFENYFDYSDTLINFSKYFYNYAWPEALPTKFMSDPDGEPLIPTDPMVYNLKINNPTLRTASMEGGPIGDLTWELENGYNSTQIQILTDVESESPEIQKEYFLDQNYPKPFNPATTINFHLPSSQQVNLEVFNVLGQKVKKLLDGEVLNAGRHSYNFDASGFSSGIYFYKLKVGNNFQSTKKMMLIK